MALYYYLKNGRYPRDSSESVKRRIRKQAAKYEAYGGKVYRKTEVEDELGPELLHEGRVDEVIKAVHEEGHFGVRNTYRRVCLQYEAPNLKDRVERYVKACHTCQIRKRLPRKRNAPARPIPIRSDPFYMVGCDAVGPTLNPSPSGNRYILVAVDYLTKWPMARAVARIDEETTAKFLFEEVVERYGVPNYLLTDRGSNFTSRYVHNFLKNLGCRHLTTTSYRRQTNGCCERLNQTLVNTIAKLAQDEDKLDRWDEFVGPALMAIRTMPSDATGYTPAYLLYGREMRTPATWPPPRQDFVLGEEYLYIAERAEHIKRALETIREDARNKAEMEKQRNKKRYDQTVLDREKFAVGEQVLMKDQTPPSKFHARWLGPLTVTGITDYGVYYLTGPGGRKIRGAVNGDMLIPYRHHKRLIPDIQVRRAEHQFQAWLERQEY